MDPKQLIAALVAQGMSEQEATLAAEHMLTSRADDSVPRPRPKQRFVHPEIVDHGVWDRMVGEPGHPNLERIGRGFARMPGLVKEGLRREGKAIPGELGVPDSMNPKKANEDERISAASMLKAYVMAQDVARAEEARKAALWETTHNELKRLDNMGQYAQNYPNLQLTPDMMGPMAQPAPPPPAPFANDLPPQVNEGRGRRY